MSLIFERYSLASSGLDISGSETISRRGTLLLLKSTKDISEPVIRPPLWISLPVSSSRWTLLILIFFFRLQSLSPDIPVFL